MHSSSPGGRPKVIYWYRTAPGLRVGRPALDDGAMRTLEEQYPDIDFDWPYILDVVSMTPVEVEGPIPVRRRKLRPADVEVPDDPLVEQEVVTVAPPTTLEPGGVAAPARPPAGGPQRPDLLSELLGRGIATSLRTRHAELAAQLEASPAGAAAKAVWRERLGALDPDGWATPDDVLTGIASVEHDADELEDAIHAAPAG